MQIVLAEHAGFCQGVKLAVDMAQKAVGSRKQGSAIYSYGPVIHNPQVVRQLADRGLLVVDSLDALQPGDSILIRSHGVVPELLEEAAKRKIAVIDATCPLVRQVQQEARHIVNEGYKLLIIGDAKHPEVIGLKGWSGGRALVLTDVSQLTELDLSGQVAVIAQTTQSQKKYAAVVAAIRKYNSQAVIKQTICPATEERQKSAEKLAQVAEVMVVIGGSNSSNTAKLTQICRDAGARTYQIETAAALQPQWFINIKVAGITAGASTPDWIIEGVIEKMSELNEMELNQQDNAVTEDIAAEAIAEENAAAEAVEEAEVTAEAAEPVAEPADEDDDEESVAMLQAQEMDIKTLVEGEIITGTVVKISNDEVLVDIGAKSEGIIPVKELSSFNIASPNDVVAVGEEIEVLVTKAEDEDGKVWLSKKQVDAEKLWTKMAEYKEAGEIISGKVWEQVKGGLIVDVGLRAFLPASQVSVKYVENLGEYVDQEIQIKIIEIDKDKNKLIVSRKAFLIEESAAKREELINSLEAGQVIEGEVKRIAKFGAFIDLGGVDGLLHISEMSWHRIADPSDVVAVGDKIKVKVLKVDSDKERISLGLKQVLPNPWETIFERYAEGDIVEAKVLRMAPFGVFVQLEPGIEGLVHISHLADRHVAECADAVSIGEVVRVKILSIMQDDKKMRLSIKEAAREEGTADEEQSADPVAEAPAEPVEEEYVYQPDDAPFNVIGDAVEE